MPITVDIATVGLISQQTSSSPSSIGYFYVFLSICALLTAIVSPVTPVLRSFCKLCKQVNFLPIASVSTDLPVASQLMSSRVTVMRDVHEGFEVKIIFHSSRTLTPTPNLFLFLQFWTPGLVGCFSMPLSMSLRRYTHTLTLWSLGFVWTKDRFWLETLATVGVSVSQIQSPRVPMVGHFQSNSPVWPTYTLIQIEKEKNVGCVL